MFKRNNSLKISLILTLFVTATTAIALSACGKKNTAPAKTQAVANTPPPAGAPLAAGGNSTANLSTGSAGSTELVGTWVSTCQALEYRYVQDKYTIQADGKAEKTTQDFLEETCKTPAQQESVTGTANYGAVVSASENIKAIDLDMKTQSKRTIYQFVNGKLCFGDDTSKHTTDNRPSTISCEVPFTRN